MDYRKLDDRFEARWLLFLALLSGVGVGVALFTGLLDLLNFTVPFLLLCSFGAFAMTPSLRFRFSRWAQDGIVFSYIRRLPNGMRWVLTFHPKPRLYLARQAWRLSSMDKFDSLADCDAALGLSEADLKTESYGKRLMMLTDLGASPEAAWAVKYVQATFALGERYGCDAQRVRQLCRAAGSAEEALRMLDEGIPAEYILAMGVE